MAITLVQSKAATATTGTTLTLSSSTTAGHCVVVVCTNQVTSVTLGGAAGNFSKVVGGGAVATNSVAIWVDPNCSGSQTSVAVTGGDLFYAYEVSGVATTSVVDKSASQIITSAVQAWSSTATAATTQAAEFWIGAVNKNNGGSGTLSLSGPSSPWTNLAGVPSGGSGAAGNQALSGWQITTSTGTATYSGTTTGIGDLGAYAAVVVTLLPASTTDSATGSVQVPKPALSGTATYATAASGGVKVPKPALAGSATAFPAATGSVKVPKPALAGTATFIPADAATGSVKVPKPKLSGTAAFGPAATGSVKVPKPALAGTAVAVPTARGSVAVPKPRLAGTSTVANPVNGSGGVRAVKPVLGGTATVANPDAATGSVKVPKPALHGTAKFGPSAHGSVKVPKPALHGTAVFQIPQLIISIASTATTDPFGNPVTPGGIAIYNGTQQAFLGENVNIPGENVLEMATGATFEGEPFRLLSGASGSGGTAFLSTGLLGPATNTSGATDLAEINLASAQENGGSSASGQLVYVNAAGVGTVVASWDDTGFNIFSGSIFGVTPSDQFAPAQGTNGFGGGVWTAGQQTALLALQATMNSIITQLQATGWFV